MPEELNGPVVPEYLVYLWQFFMELHLSRGSGGFGGNPIAFRDIKDWMDLTGNRLKKWEVQAIKKLDGVYMRHQAEAAKLRKPKK